MIDKRVKHGLAPREGKPPEFNVWCKMRQRCGNPNDKSFKDYGARGIEVCTRWRYNFAAFMADMGPRPSKDHTIERKDNAGDYSPDNCVWATRDIQARNRRQRTRPTHCDKGHPLAGDNLYIRPDNGKRGCRECRQQNMRSYYARQNAQVAP